MDAQMIANAIGAGIRNVEGALVAGDAATGLVHARELHTNLSRAFALVGAKLGLEWEPIAGDGVHTEGGGPKEVPQFGITQEGDAPQDAEQAA